MLYLTNSIIYILAQEDDIETQFGVVHVVVQGQQRSASTPAILTFHDIGLTSTLLMFCQCTLQLILPSSTVRMHT